MYIITHCHLEYLDKMSWMVKKILSMTMCLVNIKTEQNLFKKLFVQRIFFC